MYVPVVRWPVLIYSNTRTRFVESTKTTIFVLCLTKKTRQSAQSENSDEQKPRACAVLGEQKLSLWVCPWFRLMRKQPLKTVNSFNYRSLNAATRTGRAPHYNYSMRIFIFIEPNHETRYYTTDPQNAFSIHLMSNNVKYPSTSREHLPLVAF